MKESLHTELSEMLNSFPGMIFWVQDGETPSFLHFENVNEVTGYTAAEIQKLTDGWQSLIFVEDLPYYRKKLDELAKYPTKDLLEIEYRIRKKDGNAVYLIETIQVLRDNADKIVKRTGVISDVSKYKSEMELLRDEIEELSLLNSSKDNFISILSHDLRAPFTSILGFSEIILNEPSLPEKDKAEYVKFIYDSSNNQLRLINHLFDWSQIQTGRAKFEIQRLHAQSIVHNCVSYLTGIAMRKNVHINVKIPESIHIDADERFVTKLFTNIISNAVKYSFEDSVIEIIGNIYNDEFIEFVIKDKGVGISENNREKIFNIAKLFSTEGTKGEKGSGLGLTLAKQIVEKHKGEFWFYSNEGKGSEFHFTLPAATSYILLVFDDSEKLDEMKNKLKENFPNLEVLTTENAFEAMETISEKSPSIVIIEHRLPLMDGLQLVNAVRERHKLMKIPFIVFVNSEPDDIIKAYQEINVKILKQKPSVTDSLKDKIEMLLYS